MCVLSGIKRHMSGIIHLNWYVVLTMGPQGGVLGFGGVAKLAYAGDLKSSVERRVGSNPTAPTSN